MSRLQEKQSYNVTQEGSLRKIDTHSFFERMIILKFTYTHDDAFETEFDYGTLTVSGDETKGYRPFQLMVSSIAVCSASVLRKVLEKKRVTISDMSVEAEVERDPNRANRLTHIALHYKVVSPDADEKKVGQAVGMAHKNCPMAQTVEDSVSIEETFELIQE